MDEMLLMLEQATLIFEFGRVLPGKLLYLEINCWLEDEVMSRSCFGSFPIQVCSSAWGS